ncbi:hypothetical protein ES703_26778 [subsurface metagenome]
MTNFSARTAKHFVLIKAARQIKQEIEKAGLDNLKTLAEKGISIVHTYFNGCSPQEQATYRRDLNALLQMGVTLDMLLTEVARQMPEIAPEMEGKDNYKQAEIRNLEAFLRSGQNPK